MKNLIFIVSGILLILSASCQPQKSVCEIKTGTPVYLTTLPESIPTPTPKPGSAPIPVKVGGKTILVDQVIEGPLCDGSWSGTVYVTCKFQVYAWIEKPLFLKNCSLNIEPGTVVYVAYHNDTAYYNGCSCHTGETAGP
jgi:hypothetical protein